MRKIQTLRRKIAAPPVVFLKLESCGRGNAVGDVAVFLQVAEVLGTCTVNGGDDRLSGVIAGGVCNAVAFVAHAHDLDDERIETGVMFQLFPFPEEAADKLKTALFSGRNIFQLNHFQSGGNQLLIVVSLTEIHGETVG